MRFCVAATGARAQYKFTDLGTSIPGATQSYASEINAGGQVVGTFSLSSGAGGGFLYSDGTARVLTALGVGTQYAGGGAAAINDSGQIAGELGISLSVGHACIYAGGTVQDLGTLGGTDSCAASINDNGQVVGTSDVTPGNDSPQDAFLYSNGTMTDLDQLVGGKHQSSADAINNAGKVVGNCGGSAFVYANGTVTTIASVLADAINDAGEVVGEITSSNGGHPGHAFLWSPGAGVTDLGTLPAPYGQTSTAFGINDSGQIVGDSYSPTVPPNGPPPYPHAFLYSNGTMKDLNNLTSAPGFTLNNATAVNAAGQIVGTAQVDGVSPTTDIAFLLTPLEPGDANGDGQVDVNDLTIVLTNFGQIGAAWSQGDFNGNGTVDVNDLTIVLSNYGYGVSAGAGPHPVPEPSSLAILLAAAAALAPLALRRRQCNPHTPCAESDVGYG